MNTYSISQETYKFLQKDFNLPDPVEDFDEEKMIAKLTQVVAYMLDREFEKLLQVCYRIDLAEEMLKEILHLSEPDAIAKDLAVALWERQKLKIKIRKMYSE